MSSFKFKPNGVNQARVDLEVEIRNMLDVLDSIEKETSNLDDCWMGRGRDAADRKFKEFNEQAKEMAIKTRAYAEFLDYLLMKYPKMDQQLEYGLNKNIKA